jgi:hypothetical protein
LVTVSPPLTTLTPDIGFVLDMAYMISDVVASQFDPPSSLYCQEGVPPIVV